jgi:hypothetical protein
VNFLGANTCARLSTARYLHDSWVFAYFRKHHSINSDKYHTHHPLTTAAIAVSSFSKIQMTLVKNAAQNPMAAVDLTIDEPELEIEACKWVGKAMNDKNGEDISWIVV